MDRHWKHAKEVGSHYITGKKEKKKERLSYINECNKYNTLNSHCGSAALSHYPGKAVILVEGN